MPIFSSVNIISKWSWCPVFRCFVQTKLFELDGSSCFSFISRGGWYSLMRPRRFHSRFFSDIEWISRNSASVSLLFFYLSILFFSHSCTTMNMMDAPGGKFQLSCLCFWHSVTKNSKSSLGPVFRCLVYLTVFFKDLYISFLFRVNEDTITRLFVMFLFYFSKWVVQSYVSTEDFILPFSRILNKLVGIPSYLVRCWYIDIFFLFSFLYNHEYDGHIRK